MNPKKQTAFKPAETPRQLMRFLLTWMLIKNKRMTNAQIFQRVQRGGGTTFITCTFS